MSRRHYPRREVIRDASSAYNARWCRVCALPTPAHVSDSIRFARGPLVRDEHDVRAIPGTSRLFVALDLAPHLRIDRRKTDVSLRARLDQGDVEAIGDRQRLRINFRAADNDDRLHTAAQDI